MGLFSSKTVINVSSVAYNVAGDANERANFLKQSLIYLNAAQESIGEKLPRMYLRSMGVKLKRAYRHAAALPQGLPTASMQLWEYQEFEEAIQTLLDIEHGPSRFKVEDVYLTGGGTAPDIERYLNQTYGWDSVTGLMSSPPAGFAEDASVQWYYEPTQSRYGDQSPRAYRTYVIEFRHDPESIDADLVLDVSLQAAAEAVAASETLVALISEWMVSTRSDQTVSRPFETGDVTGTVSTPVVNTVGARTTITTTTVTTTTDGVTTTVRTKIVDDTTSEAVPREFVLGTGEWPILDALWISRANVEQTFFPSIPFRVDNKDMLADNLSETDQYKDVVKIISLMGMDAVSIRDQINENPDIKEIDYAFMVAGANMNTESQAEMDYLFRFWDLCRERSTAYQADHTSWVAQALFERSKPKTNSLVIQDPQSKNGAYKITIEWDYINKSIVTGEVAAGAKIGQLSITTGATTVHEFGATNSRSSVDSTVVRIRKQISETQYEELAISGAVHKNDVYEGKTVETLARDARNDPDKNEGFLIPLHMGIFNTMSMVKRTQLAQECIYLVFNTYVKTKKKWYQTGWFKVLLAIVLIVITIVSAGTATPITSSVWGAATVAAALGITGALGLLLVGMALSALYSYMVSYLMGRWSAGFESVFGKKWAAVVMSIISIGTAMLTGGNGLNSESWLKTAVQIIDIASQLFTAYAKGTIVAQKAEYDAFMDKVEEDQKLLEKLSNEFFGEDDLVSVDYLLQLQKTLREDSPTTFLARTLMTGSDVVDITLGQVSEMVTMNITPRLQGIY